MEAMIDIAGGETTFIAEVTRVQGVKHNGRNRSHMFEKRNHPTESDLDINESQTAAPRRIANKRKASSQMSRMNKEKTSHTPSLPEASYPKPVSDCCWNLTTLPSQLSEDHLEPSLDFFFSTYARPMGYKLEFRGFLEYVFELHSRSAPQSAVRLSTLAVGTFLLGSWMDRSHDSHLSRKFYGKAVSAMKEQLCSSSACSNDEMLISILLLQLYEDLVGFLKSEKESRAHLNGALAVIKHRGVKSFNSEVSHALLLSVRMQVCDVALHTKQAIPTGIFDWSGVRPQSDLLPRNKLEQIRLQIANLQAMVFSRRLMDPSTRNKNMQEIINRAATIEQMLAAWYANLPLAWYPARISTTQDFPQSILEAGLYKQLCDVYPSISIAGTFNKYRWSLLRIKAITVNCITQQTKSLTTMSKQAHTLNQMQLLADDICASIPYHLGDRTVAGWLGDKTVHYPSLPGQELPEGHHQTAQAIGAWHLLDPMKELIMMKVKLRTGQREWVGKQMMRIAKIYNIGR